MSNSTSGTHRNSGHVASSWQVQLGLQQEPPEPQLFELGKSGSGGSLRFNCEHLNDKELTVIAEIIYKMVGPYRGVAGVHPEGTRLADIMRSWASTLPSPGRSTQLPYLLLDDVYRDPTRLNSLFCQVFNQQYIPSNEYEFVAAVIFACIPLPHWCKAVFQLPRELWGV